MACQSNTWTLGACTCMHTNMGHVIVSIVSCTLLKQNADESIRAVDSDPWRILFMDFKRKGYRAGSNFLRCFLFLKRCRHFYENVEKAAANKVFFRRILLHNSQIDYKLHLLLPLKRLFTPQWYFSREQQIWIPHSTGNLFVWMSAESFCFYSMLFWYWV